MMFGLTKDESSPGFCYPCRQTCHLDENRKCRDCGWTYPDVVLDVPQRPPREDYVRVTVQCDGFTAEPAVEYRDGDNFDQLAHDLECIVEDHAQVDGDQMASARSIGRGIAEHWPDRAYFVEVWQEGRRGFAQSVQPFGFPRNR